MRSSAWILLVLSFTGCQGIPEPGEELLSEIIDENTGWKLVEVASYEMNIRTPGIIPFDFYRTEHFNVHYVEEKGPTFVNLSRDFAFSPVGGPTEYFTRLLIWNPEHSGGLPFPWAYSATPGSIPSFDMHEPIYSEGEYGFSILRVALKSDSYEASTRSTYNLEYFSFLGEEYSVIEDVPYPIRRFSMEGYFVPLNEPGEYQTTFGYSSIDKDIVLNVVDLEVGTVEQPCIVEDWDPSRFQQLLAYDYQSGISLWFEEPEGEELSQFAFRTNDGEVSYYNGQEIGLDPELTDEVAHFGDGFPTPVTLLDFYVNNVDGTPVAYFRFAGSYLGIRMDPDRPANDWLLWQKRLPGFGADITLVGRLHPSPSAGPGDCWVAADRQGDIQIVDLGTGEVLFRGKLETSPFLWTDEESFEGCLTIGDIDPDMPQEICWWDMGAWTLRVYRLEPPYYD